MTADLTPWPTFVAEQVRALEERRRAAVTAARTHPHHTNPTEEAP